MLEDSTDYNVGTYLIQVDHIELLASDTMEHAAFVIQKDDFERLEFLGKLAGSGVCINIENLAFWSFCETSQDGKSTGTD